MKSLRRAGRLCAAMQVGFALGFMFVATGRGQEAAGFTEVTPNVLVFATRTGNVVALVGPDGALLIGTPSADSTERISSELAKRTKSPARYVLIAPEDPAHSEGDAGWGRRGAFVAMQEKTLERIGGHVMGAPKPPAEGFVLGSDELRPQWRGGPHRETTARLQRFGRAGAFSLGQTGVLGRSVSRRRLSGDRFRARRDARWPAENSRRMDGSRVSRGAGARRSDDRRGPESLLRHDRHCSRPRAPFDRCRAHGEPGDRGASDGGV